VANSILWFESNWTNLVQSLGVIASLLFTAISIRSNTRARQASDFLTLAERFNEVWSETGRNPSLHRIFDTECDLVEKPITAEEREYLNKIFVHYYVSWLLIDKKQSLLPRTALKIDAQHFFILPIPNRVWTETRQTRDPRFVSFVEESLSGV